MNGLGILFAWLRGRSLWSGLVSWLCLGPAVLAGATTGLDEWRAEIVATRALAENNVPRAFERAQALDAQLSATAGAADRARSLNLLARIALYRARTDEATALAKRALDLASAAKERASEVEAHLTIALTAIHRGEIDETVSATAMAMNALDDIDRPDLSAEAELRAAMMYRRIGHPEQSMAMCLQAVDAAKDAKSPLALVYARQGLGSCFQLNGQAEEAYGQYVRMVEAARAVPSKLLECDALIGSGGAADKLGRPEEAEARLRAALALAQEAEAPFSIATAKFCLAHFLGSHGRTSAALVMIDAVIAGYDAHPNPLGRWHALGERSELHQRMGAMDLALADAKRADELAEKIGLPYLRRDSAERVAAVHAAAGRPAEAYERLAEAMRISSKVANDELSDRLHELLRRQQQENARRKLGELDRRNREQEFALREQEQKRREQWMLLGGVSVALLLAGFLLLRGRFLLRSLHRQRTELAMTQALQSAVIDGANTTLIATDTVGVISVFNAGAETLLGYTRSEIVGRLGFMNLVDAKDSTEISLEVSRRAGRPIMAWEALQDGLGAVATIERELTLRARDGRRVPVHLRITQLRAPAGAVDGLLFAVRDLTVERAATEALARTYSQLATVFETTPDGFLVFDRHGKITDCNAAAERIFGLTRAQMLDRGLRPAGWGLYSESGEFVPPTEHPAMPVLYTGQARRAVVVSVRQPDGRVAWLSSNIEPLREADGSVSGAVASITDITTLKAAERALREHAEARVRDSESRFRILADLMPCAVAILSPQGEVLYCNTRRREEGQSPEGDESVCRDGMMVFHPEDHAGIEQVRAASFAPGIAHAFETRFRRSDAEEWRWHRFNVVPQRDEAGKVLCWLSVGVDVHDHRESAAALERAVAERTAELQASESRFRSMFEHAPISLWECDGSGVKRYLDDLRAQGVTDLDVHLEHGLALVDLIFERLRVLDLNQAAESLHKAPKAELLARPQSAFMVETAPFLRECLLALWAGQTLVEGETVICTRTGARRYVQMSIMVQPGFEQTWGKLTTATVDVSAPRVARQALVESRERLERIFDTVGEGVVLLEADGRVLECNAAADELLGLRSGAASWASPDLQFIDAQGAVISSAETAVAIALRTGEAQRDSVMGIVRHEREVIWISSHVAPYRDAKRDFGGVVWSFADITLARQREALIRESEARFRLAFEQGGVGMGLFSFPEGRWQRVNRTICEMVGRSAAELADRTVFELVHPEDRSVFTRCIDLWRNGDAVTLRSEVRLRGGDEKYIAVATTCSLVHDEAGRPLYVFAQMENVTAQRQAEVALLESQARLAAIFQAMGEGIIVRNAEGRIVDWNSAFERIGGFSREQVIDRQEIDGLALFTEAGQRLASSGNPSLVALKTGRSERNRVIGVSRDDRPSRWWLLNAEPLRDGDGSVKGVVTSVTDITDQKHAEQELRAAHAQAVEALRIRSAFLATVSHEIRTPMNGILGTVEMLATTPLNPRQREISRIINQSAHSLLRIIDDLLDLSRIESGKLHVEISDFNPRSVIEDTVALFRAPAETKGVELSRQVAGALDTTVRGDPIRFRQVLTNLLNNAVKFTSIGRIEIAARADNNCPADVLTLHVEVRDTGCGVPANMQNKLFTPFVQADSSARRRHAGAGLGLAISGHLVELMGGQIGFTSEEGKGSTFWFKLALSRKDVVPPSATTDALPAEVPARSLRILVVEDNEAGRFVARLQLEHLGHQVDMAEDGEEALQRLAERSYDVILMDCQMPRVDGYEATRRIRAGVVPGLDPQVPIIALTAFAMPGDRERGLAVGMNDYVTKPLSGEALRQALIRCGLTSAGVPAGAEKPREEAPFDRVQVAQLAKINAPDGRPLSVVYAAMFSAEVPAKLDEIDRWHRDRNGVELARAAHSLAGNAANLGAVPLRNALRAVVVAARTEDWPAAADAIARVQAAWARLQEALKEILPNSP